MLLKKVNSFIALLMCCVMFFCGCTTEEITSPADELMSYSWEKTDKFGKELSLSFSEDTATVKISLSDYDYSITGTVLVDDETIKIFDENLKQTYSFSYVLYGDKVEITCDDKTIELDKVT